MFIVNTYLRSDTYDELVLAMTFAGIGHLITGQNYQVSLTFPHNTEVLHLGGEIARILYRTPNGTVFAWVDAYDGETSVFQLSSATVWDKNLARIRARAH